MQRHAAEAAAQQRRDFSCALSGRVAARKRRRAHSSAKTPETGRAPDTGLCRCVVCIGFKIFPAEGNRVSRFHTHCPIIRVPGGKLKVKFIEFVQRRTPASTKTRPTFGAKGELIQHVGTMSAAVAFAGELGLIRNVAQKVRWRSRPRTCGEGERALISARTRRTVPSDGPEKPRRRSERPGVRRRASAGRSARRSPALLQPEDIGDALGGNPARRSVRSYALASRSLPNSALCVAQKFQPRIGFARQLPEQAFGRLHPEAGQTASRDSGIALRQQRPFASRRRSNSLESESPRQFHQPRRTQRRGARLRYFRLSDRNQRGGRLPSVRHALFRGCGGEDRLISPQEPCKEIAVSYSLSKMARMTGKVRTEPRTRKAC